VNLKFGHIQVFIFKLFVQFLLLFFFQLLHILLNFHKNYKTSPSPLDLKDSDGYRKYLARPMHYQKIKEVRILNGRATEKNFRKGIPMFNFSANDRNKDISVLPDGWYQARVETAEETTFKTGSSGIKIVFTLTDNANYGRKIYNYLVDTQGGRVNARKCIEALGLEVVENSENYYLTQQLIGRECEIQLVSEEYNGKTNNKIKYGGYRPLENGPSTVGGLPF
jgi:hypothetical protein